MPGEDPGPAVPPPPSEAENASNTGPPPTDRPIRWDAPASCPDGEAVRQRTSQLVGRELQPGELAVEGSITQSGDLYVLDLRLTTDEAHPSQRLEARQCETLAQTAALIAAVLLDPVAAVTTVDREMGPEVPEEPVPTTAQPPVATPNPAPVEPAPKAPPPQRRTSRRTTKDRPFFGWARLRAGGSFGAVPGGTGGFDGSFALGTARLRGELIGAYWVGREVRRNGGRATVSLGNATVRFCGLVLPGKVQIPLCAGAELGAMRADARGVPQAETRRGFWLAGHAAAGVRWAFRPRLSLWVEAQVFVPAVFPRFELVDPDDASLTAEVYTPNAAGPRGLVGLEYKLF